MIEYARGLLIKLESAGCNWGGRGEGNEKRENHIIKKQITRKEMIVRLKSLHTRMFPALGLLQTFCLFGGNGHGLKLQFNKNWSGQL